MARKYGLGKYGADTYDLGGEVIPPEPPIFEDWVPIPAPPGFPCGAPEIWTPAVTPAMAQVPNG